MQPTFRFQRKTRRQSSATLFLHLALRSVERPVVVNVDREVILGSVEPAQVDFSAAGPGRKVQFRESPISRSKKHIAHT
jgi:hypothetical protein